MQLKLKEFNALKTAKKLYTQRLIFFFQVINLKTEVWITIKQHLKKKDLKHYQINNSIVCFYFKNSIFKGCIPSINSTNMLIYVESMVKSNFNLKQLVNLDSTFDLLMIKLNNKFYLNNKKIINLNLNYKTLMKNFTFLLLKSSIVSIKNLKKVSK
nr:hypothetical protein [Lithodesmioides sp. mgcode 4]